MKSMYSLPSSSMRVEPVPRAIASSAMRAKDWLPGATCRRSWATMRCDRGPTSRRSVMVAGAARPEDSVGGLRQGATWLRPSHHSPFQRGAARPEHSVGGLRQGATWLRPSWHYSFHSRPGSRNRSARWVAMRAAPVHLKAERRGRAAHEAREARLVERVAAQALLLVIEPAKPRRRAVRASADADTVELDEIAPHVRLEDRARYPPRGEARERRAQGVGRGREDDVAVLGVVDVGALHPHGRRGLDAPV